MPVSLNELDIELKKLLKPEQFSDYCPNGLQVEGRSEVRKIVSGVTACQALIDEAVAAQADLILVHHGYFWRGEDQTITGMKRKRIQTLLDNNISLAAFHLPLDAHVELGNNAQLAKLLGFIIDEPLDRHVSNPIVFSGRTSTGMSHEAMCQLLEEKLDRKPLGIKGNKEKIESIAWCTGAAQNFIEMAVNAGVDAYLTGEVSEQTVHIARESGVHFFSAGHHATERYGVQAVGNFLADKYSLRHEFIDVDNPA
ncbi:MAG: Nif3-like dinuclear metal center hexameric protein [Gammaproteobacteria bacterium]|nr:Nif3-like dinuclear metal center hexameric protein [Gammaproteobacteria bacterium]MDD9896593.1 Nif3-like dinuclear metal center hexameric protein [Gammaproteobacteria bacterium]MDD9960278.1 Nif3-like dinuclear metal center hexameric protein [Gammaproteobacteria bacterium]